MTPTLTQIPALLGDGSQAAFSTIEAAASHPTERARGSVARREPLPDVYAARPAYTTDQMENAGPAGCQQRGLGGERPARGLRDPGAEHADAHEGARTAEHLGQGDADWRTRSEGRGPGGGRGALHRSS